MAAVANFSSVFEICFALNAFVSYIQENRRMASTRIKNELSLKNDHSCYFLDKTT
jgi:hypothetical protein